MFLAAWYHVIFAVIFAGLASFLMFIILLQRGKGVGLAGAFGGAGGQTVFGSKTGDVLTVATIIFAGLFLLYTIVLNVWAFQPQRANIAPSIAPTSVPPEPAPTMTPEESLPTGGPSATIEFPATPPGQPAGQPAAEPANEQPGTPAPAAEPSDQPADDPAGADTPVNDTPTSDEPASAEPATEPEPNP